MTEEEKREYHKRWREEHKEHTKEYAKRYQKEHKEQINANARKRYAKNPEKILSYQRERRKMKESDATETAYKNGYKKGVEDVLTEIDRFLYMNFRFCKEELGNDDTEYIQGILDLNTKAQNFIAELKKKFTEDQQ
jgi:hypothetical protein